MSKTLIATYETPPAAARAVNRLYEEGFTDEQISMLVSDATKEKHLALEVGTKAPEGAAGGAALGGALGAIAAGLTVVAGIVIPGLGLLVAGPLVAALAGLGVGGVAGGLIGGLVGLGFSETEAKVVEEAIRKGNVALAITAENADRAGIAHGVFQSTQALQISKA
jgi:hypothetical protein